MQFQYCSIDKYNLQELIELSSNIDLKKNKSGSLYGKKDDLSVVASAIVALMNGKNTALDGERLDNAIKNLIVNRNYAIVESNDGVKLYDQLQKKQLPGTYKIKKTLSGFCFNLFASNGELLVTSEVYTRLDSCTNGIKSLQSVSCAAIEDQTLIDYQHVKNPKYEVYCDRAGEYRFRLSTSNGQIIAISNGYETKEKCFEIIELVKASANTNDIEKS